MATVNLIRIRKTIDSDTLRLPELIPFMGHTVDIVIEDQSSNKVPVAATTPGTGDWDAFARAAKALAANYDFDAVADQDAQDLRDAEDQMK